MRTRTIHLPFQATAELPHDHGVSGLSGKCVSAVKTGATQATLRDRVLADSEAVAALLAGLHLYVRDTFKVRRLLQPTAVAADRASAAAAAAAAAAAEPPAADAAAAPFGEEAAASGGAAGASDSDTAGSADDGAEAGSQQEAAEREPAAPRRPPATGPSVLSVLMGVKPLQHALIDLLMDLMVTACQNAKKVELGLLLPLDRQQPARQQPSGECAAVLVTRHPS